MTMTSTNTYQTEVNDLLGMLRINLSAPTSISVSKEEEMTLWAISNGMSQETAQHYVKAVQNLSEAIKTVITKLVNRSK